MKRGHIRAVSMAIWMGVAVVLALVTIVIPASRRFTIPAKLVQSGQPQPVQGTLTALIRETTQQTPEGPVTSQQFAVRLDSGPQRGQISTVTQELTPTGSLSLHVGDRVLLAPAGGAPGSTDGYYIVDAVRSGILWLLAVAFVGVVVAVGGVFGARALLGLAVSFLVIVRFIIPGILAGNSPLLISLIGAFAIVLTTLYVAHGVSAKTTVALIGTTASLVLTGGLALAAISAAKLTGMASDEAASLQVLAQGTIDLRGLLLGAFVIGTLGLLNDVTVAQASAVFELQRADHRLGWRALYGRAMNVGRDHIASMVNTLFLAYAGASLPLLILLAVQAQPLPTLLNREFIAVEIVRTLVGSIGIVAAVPVTTILAALCARRFSDARAPDGTLAAPATGVPPKPAR